MQCKTVKILISSQGLKVHTHFHHDILQFTMHHCRFDKHKFRYWIVFNYFSNADSLCRSSAISWSLDATASFKSRIVSSFEANWECISCSELARNIESTLRKRSLAVGLDVGDVIIKLLISLAWKERHS